MEGTWCGRNPETGDVGYFKYRLEKKNAIITSASLLTTAAYYNGRAVVKRVNECGTGVPRVKKLGFSVAIQQSDAAFSFRVLCFAVEGENLFPLTRGAVHDDKLMDIDWEKITVYVSDIYGYKYAANMSVRSDSVAYKGFDGYGSGYIWEATLDRLIEFYETKTASAAKTAMTWIYFRDMGLRATTGGTVFKTSTTMTNPRTRTYNLIKWAVDNGQDPHELTYYQLQWALLNNENMLAEDAYSACQIYEWCKTEGGDNTAE